MTIHPPLYLECIADLMIESEVLSVYVIVSLLVILPPLMIQLILELLHLLRLVAAHH